MLCFLKNKRKRNLEVIYSRDIILYSLLLRNLENVGQAFNPLTKISAIKYASMKSFTECEVQNL